VSAAQAAQTAMAFDSDQAHKILSCEYLGLFIYDVSNHGDPPVTRPAYLVVTLGTPDEQSPSGAQLRFIDALTNQTLQGFAPTLTAIEDLTHDCGPQPA